jgi:hypothetical protein
MGTGMIATIVDPLVDPVPAAWDGFVARAGLLPLWGSQLLRTAAWCTQTPSSMVLVHEPGDATPVALFHARHLGLVRPTRFLRPGRTPALSMTECRTTPAAMGAGIAFAAGAGAAERAEAVRAFEAAIRKRTGAGGLAVAYRELPPAYLPSVPTSHRIRLRLGPTMVLHNAWSDLDKYLGTLPGKWRSQLRKIHHTIESDPTLRIEFVDTLDSAEACWLAELVRRRHISAKIPRPPLPARYFAQFAALPASRFLTYRDAGGKLLAYSAILAHGDTMVLVWWGSLEQVDGGRPNLYFDQYLRLVRLLIQSGRQRVVLGKGMEHIKARYGARPEPLWGVVGFR